MNGGTTGDLRVDLTAPVFDKVIIRLDPDYYPGSEFVIEAINNSKSNKYVQKVALNRDVIKENYISFKDIISGGKLTFFMGSEPPQNRSNK